jgi:predicted metallopeptidase
MESPQRCVRSRAAASRSGFDFTGFMRPLCGDMVSRVSELGHIDLGRVAFSFCQTRKSVSHGMYASLTPLRFVGGKREMVRRGRRYGMQRVLDSSGREMLYILNFYLPRFLNLPLREKLNTVVHELWHIGPKCDGDLRRFGGRCYAHSGSQKKYDALVSQLVDRWLRLDPPESLFAALQFDFRGLYDKYGSIHGTRVKSPKLIPLP